MSENNKPEDYIKFIDKDNSEDNFYISFNFNIQVTDALLMFHICHLYYNCMVLIDNKEMTEDEIDNIITFEYVLKSVQEALDNRIKCLSSSYIDEAYQWCINHPADFDICLDYFNKIKSYLKGLKSKFKNGLVTQKELSEYNNIKSLDYVDSNENKQQENSN